VKIKEECKQISLRQRISAPFIHASKIMIICNPMFHLIPERKRISASWVSVAFPEVMGRLKHDVSQHLRDIS
jgi:hypothetical protein